MHVVDLAPRVALLDPIEIFRRSQKANPLSWQEAYLWEWRNTVVLKGRQVGASTSASVLAIRYCQFHSDALVAIVSPSQKQSTEVKKRALSGIRALSLPLTLDNATTLAFANGSRIMSLPGSAKSVRGWTADMLIIDEAAFLDPETFLAARATAATGGRIIVQSTPAGPYGPFHDLYQEAVDPSTPAGREELKLDPTLWVRYRISSEDVSTIGPAFLASEKASMNEMEYAQEYQGVFAAAGMGLIDPSSLDVTTDAEDIDPWADL